MMLGFKRRFAPFVWEGSKEHTIRLPRRIMPKPGEQCHCFVDSRQKGMARLGDWLCTRVEPITILEDGIIFIAGVILADDEREAFCWRDGFRPARSTEAKPAGSFDVFMKYWTAEAKKAKGKRDFPFNGYLIHWRYSEATRAPKPVQVLNEMTRSAYAEAGSSRL